MPDTSSEGQIQVYLNADRTQALADIHPPQPEDSSSAAADLVERLGRLGVAYGIRGKEIEAAIRAVAESPRTVTGVLVAEGSVPVPGDDARLAWLVPESMVY